ncbi:30S ribosomal protein S7 [Candidatus Woesearchaeota archaeon]|nr:30S ribosomal protein S7 [Candidatus Woesearchaeota archaeon]
MNFKLFNKWDVSGIQVSDEGLKRYVSVIPVLVPRSGGRYGGIRFYKSKYNIVERLMNKLMGPGHKGKKHKLTSGHTGGKGFKVYKLIEKTFEVVEQLTKKNPIEVFVKAVENAAPRDEITSIEYGGARYPQSVDCAPQRRIDVALRMMVQGSFHKSYNNKKKMHEFLAEEIVNAYNKDNKSNAIAKKIELERQADSAR